MSGRSDGSADTAEGKLKSFDDYDLALGDVMRGERATKGKSLLEAQRDTKIKAEYLAGIEEADLSVFETPGFISGYVKAYARYLGMNPDWVYRRFCEESGFSHIHGLEAQVRRRRKPAGPAAPARAARGHAGDAVLARSPINAAPRHGPFQGIQASALGSIAVLGALLAGLGYGGWSVLQEIQRVTLAPVDTPPAASAPERAAPENVSLEIDNAAPSIAALERLYRPEALDKPVLVPRDEPIAQLDPDAQGVFAGYRDAARVALSAPPEPPQPDGQEQAADEPPAPQVTEPEPPEVVMFARRPAWVRVRDADGTVLLEKILEQGERYVLPRTEQPPTLRAGNSGSLFFAVNGETIGPAGPGTSVAKNVVLSAEALTEKYSVADLAADPELARMAELVTEPVAPGADADDE